MFIGHPPTQASKLTLPDSGDSPDGLEAVFLANRDKLLRFLVARGAGDDAEDLLQDMWMKLEAKDLGPVSDPLPYLYRMANNLMLDRYRSSSRRERREAPPP